MAAIDDPDKAQRLARAIASDISLYNEEKIREGIAKDTFFEAVAAELEEGRELYRARVAPTLDPEGHLYWQAVCNVIVRTRASVRSAIW